MAVLEAGRHLLRRGLALLPWGSAAHEPEAGRRGPRIAVVGNCQARGVARALSVLLPDARVNLIPSGRLGRDRRSLAKGLKAYDHVFAQPLPAASSGHSAPETFAGLPPRTRLFPAIVFSAFHPDMIYVGDQGTGSGAALVPSPLHTYHSAITVFGHLRGLSASRIVGLFREETFALLGYLDGWQLSANDLSASSRAIGFDLSPDLLRWSRRGAFMHGVNHPKLFVLADVAARLAREAGLAPAQIPADAYLTDDLLDEVIWPVYPEIAAVYGVAGSYVYKRRAAPGAVPSVLDVESFVAESLAIYRTVTPRQLDCHRVEHWSGIPEIRALFDAA